MTQSPWTLVGMLSLGLMAGDCSKKASKSKEPGDKPGAPMRAAPTARPPGMTPARPMVAARLAPPSKGPTGIEACDQLIKLVCGCQSKDQTLQKACPNLQAEAPRWRATVDKRDPAQIAETRQSCRRVLKTFQDGYPECKTGGAPPAMAPGAGARPRPAGAPPRRSTPRPAPRPRP